jgi:hypothetical protein
LKISGVIMPFMIGNRVILILSKPQVGLELFSFLPVHRIVMVLVALLVMACTDTDTEEVNSSGDDLVENEDLVWSNDLGFQLPDVDEEDTVVTDISTDENTPGDTGVSDVAEDQLTGDSGVTDSGSDSASGDPDVMVVDLGDTASVDASVDIPGEVVEDTTSDLTPDAVTDLPLDTGEDSVEMPPLPTIDCALVARETSEAVVIDGLRAWHGLAFDQFGNFFGALAPNILQGNYDGELSLFVPGVGDMEQMDFLATGALVVSVTETDEIIMIDPDGSQTQIATSVGAYGVTVGPDQQVYTGNSSVIHRIDPETQEKIRWLNPGFSPRVIDFSPDGTRAYMGEEGWSGGGDVYVVDLDDDMMPIGDETVLATDVGDGWHDGLRVDACGYIYVAEYFSGNMYRISPDGEEVFRWLNPSNDDYYLHGIQFGSGIGGFDQFSIYGPQPYNGSSVGEAYAGVPYRTYEGVVLNAP